MNFKVSNLEGKPHYIVPVVLGTVGVWAGSQGPLMYEGKDLAKSAVLWNGRPVVVYHPNMKTAIAGDPEIFNKQKIGTLFNARFDSKAGALRAEAWVDPDRMRQVDDRVRRSILAGDVVEVSTGLFTDNQPAEGTFKGQEYQAIARHHLPDHLAILPDRIGACSVKMGAGLNRNAAHHATTGRPMPLVIPDLMASFSC